METPNEIEWVDAVTSETKPTAVFYEKVLGFKADEVPEGEDRYSYSMKSGEKDILGICTAEKFKKWVSGWVLYFTVEDYDQSLSQITVAGGEVFQEFTPKNPEHPRSCLAKDPAGNPIMIMETPKPTA